LYSVRADLVRAGSGAAVWTGGPPIVDSGNSLDLPESTALSDTSDTFRFRHPVTVRFRDIDIGGHAHHADALIYFEEARWAYWMEVVGQGLDELDYVLAECRVRWHARVLWPQVVDVGVRVVRVGRKHFEMEYEVRSHEGQKLQSGSTVQVMYDYATGSSKAMPAELRATLEAFDGPFD
jgi:acyl-CoA thioester hydrolase